ncbi:MAG TPA: anti-sigma factor [Acidobacteriaceae bacterium]|nr:anti-sigma factor [Acidobacteriaceae bacterium]
MSDSRLTPAVTAPASSGHTAPEDLVLFAMQLFPVEQAERIERHAGRCAVCREELGRIHGDLAAVALTAEPVAASAAARERLLAQVAREKKAVKAVTIKPAMEPAPDAAPAPRPLADFGRGKGSTLIPEPMATASRRRPPMHEWAGWALAAGFAVVAVILYGNHRTLEETAATQTSEIQRLNARAAQSHQLMDALTDPHAVRVTLTPKTPARGPVGGVTYNAQTGALVFLASNLDPIQVYKTYELWILPADGSAPIPAGTFHPDEHGNASVIMPRLPKGMDAKTFEVTIEDAGGSDKPTKPIILAGS